MANKEFSNVYQTRGFCNNIRTYCLYALFFRQIKIVVITDTDCSKSIIFIIYYNSKHQTQHCICDTLYIFIT